MVVIDCVLERVSHPMRQREPPPRPNAALQRP